jgi:hypothetical protein
MQSVQEAFVSYRHPGLNVQDQQSTEPPTRGAA